MPADSRILVRIEGMHLLWAGERCTGVLARDMSVIKGTASNRVPGGRMPPPRGVDPKREPVDGGAHGGFVAGPAEPVVQVSHGRLGGPLAVDFVLQRPEFFRAGQ